MKHPGFAVPRSEYFEAIPVFQILTFDWKRPLLGGTKRDIFGIIW